MHRLSLILMAITTLSTTPALACGMMQRTAGSGGMCGAPAATAKPGEQVPPATPAGGCACCRNMAMMQTTPAPGMSGMSMPGMSTPGMKHDMPGMPATPDMPKQ